MIWSDDDIRNLRRLWDKGLSTVAIGREIGVSKNSIVSKAHRINLEGRPSPIRRDARALVVHSQPHPVFSLPLLGSLAQTDAEAPQKPAPHDEERGCNYPMWGHNERTKLRPDGTALLCDGPISRGTYCTTHAALCYTRQAAA